MCKGLNDYTDQMVLDNLIRGLADKLIKREVLATPETECTLSKVLRFAESEESGRPSIFECVPGRSRPLSLIRKWQQGGMANAPSRQCHNCGKMLSLQHKM